MLRLAFSAVIIMFLGCSIHKPTMPVHDVEVQPSIQTESSLYYFAESQLRRKKGDLDKAVEFLHQAIKYDPDSLYLQRELAQFLWQKKEDRAALEVLDGIMARDPGNVENLILYGRINHALKYWEKAKSAYEKVIAEDPTQRGIYLLLGGLYADTGDLSFALQVYHKLVKQFPTSFTGYYLIGKIYALKDDPVEAKKNFLKALAVEPELDEARYELIKLYKTSPVDYIFVSVKPGDTIGAVSLRLYNIYDDTIKAAILRANPEIKNIDQIHAGQQLRFPRFPLNRNSPKIIEYEQEIIKNYLEIVNKHPDNIRANMELGYFYHELGKVEESERILTKLGERSQTDKNVIRYIIQLYLDRQQFDAAIIVLRNMLRGAPGSSEIHYIMAMAFDGKNDKDMAIQHFKQVSLESRFFQNAVVHISFLYQEDGRTKEAIHYLNDVIKMMPGNPDFRLYLGALYEETEAFEKAESILKQGIKIDPVNAKLHFRLGVVYDKWGKKRNSIQMMKDVIRLNPKDANALNYLGYTYADMGENLDEAERLIKEALTYKPDDGFIIDSLGWVYFKKGVYNKALEYLKKATHLVPDDPTILEHLGDAYIKTENKKKAIEIYKRSLMNANNGKEILGKKIQKLINEGY